MGTLEPGQVVLVPFPFSDLTQAKRRPAVVLANAGRGDWILCQITSNPFGDTRALQLVEDSFVSGALRTTSYARPGALFSGHRSLVVAQIGLLRDDVFARILYAVVALLLPERADGGLSSGRDAADLA